MYPDSVFKVDGKPFFPLGLQAHNSSGYSMEELEPVWQACKLMNVNSVAVAVSWERIEPVEGEFDLDIVRQIILRCREEGLRLVVLWFGTWKNGHMKYVPQWVKRDHKRFPRVITHDGFEISNLSSFYEETFNADKRAFCKVMETIRDVDAGVGTVIAVQVQNELGIVGRAIRDFGEKAQQAYLSPVPQALIDRLKTSWEGEYIGEVWQACGAKEQGSWGELFGRYGDEALQAWSMSGYVNGLAQAGKEIYSLPMYTNVWHDRQGWDIPGINYPAGGAVSKNLAIWRWNAPMLEMITPDMYNADMGSYKMFVDYFTRDDNPLYVPETGAGMPFAMGMVWAIAERGLTGMHIFGAESLLNAEDGLKPSALPMQENFRFIGSVLPLLLKYRGTGKIHAVMQEENAKSQRMSFDGWEAIADFAPFPRGDWRHRRMEPTSDRARGLIIQTGENEFFSCGVGFTITFRKNPPISELCKVPQQDNQQEYYLDFLRVEEGHFEGDNWVATRIRNGDETDFAVFNYPDYGAVRIELE